MEVEFQGVSEGIEWFVLGQFDWIGLSDREVGMVDFDREILLLVHVEIFL